MPYEERIKQLQGEILGLATTLLALTRENGHTGAHLSDDGIDVLISPRMGDSLDTYDVDETVDDIFKYLEDIQATTGEAMEALRDSVVVRAPGPVLEKIAADLKDAVP